MMMIDMLQTPRGTFRNVEIMPTVAEAEAQGYGLWFTDSRGAIYCKEKEGRLYCTNFAIILREV